MSFHILYVSITLIQPVIWRRLCIPRRIRMGQLHQALQMSFGWRDAHAHEFNVHGDRLGAPVASEPDDEDMWDENNVLVANFLSREGDEFQYDYDPGDEWIVNGKVECIECDPLAQRATPSPVPRAEVITCLDGARAGPPEDCGGPPGYRRLLREISNATHAQHQEAIDWATDDFAPERFSVDELNRQLAAMSVRTTQI